LFLFARIQKVDSEVTFDQVLKDLDQDQSIKQQSKNFASDEYLFTADGASDSVKHFFP